MTDEATLIASYLFGSMGEPYVISLPFPPHTMSVIIVALFTSHFGSRKYPMQGCCMFNKQTVYLRTEHTTSKWLYLCSRYMDICVTLLFNVLSKS